MLCGFYGWSADLRALFRRPPSKHEQPPSAAAASLGELLARLRLQAG
jgi:hypothetical protein